jgi:small subunit ribosomal protein S6
MAFYESVIIARQDLSTAQVDTLGDELANILQEGGGKVTKRENWGLRSLQFRIKKNRKGHYLYFNIEAPAAAVTEYERRMRINEDVLRYLSVRVDALEEGPSAMLQNKDRGPERSERGFGGGRDRGFGGGGGGGGFGGGRRDRGGEEGGHFDSGRRPRRYDSPTPEASS